MGYCIYLLLYLMSMLGVYATWNVYVMAMLIFYAPSHKKTTALDVSVVGGMSVHTNTLSFIRVPTLQKMYLGLGLKCFISLLTVCSHILFINFSLCWNTWWALHVVIYTVHFNSVGPEIDNFFYKAKSLKICILYFWFHIFCLFLKRLTCLVCNTYLLVISHLLSTKSSTHLIINRWQVTFYHIFCWYSLWGDTQVEQLLVLKSATCT